MTVNYQPNPLNTFDLRELKHCPPHFAAVDFNLSTSEKKISDWIWENLHGRFYFGDVYVRVASTNDKERRTQLQKRAAFEIHGEASYFAMCLPELNKF